MRLLRQPDNSQDYAVGWSNRKEYFDRLDKLVKLMRPKIFGDPSDNDETEEHDDTTVRSRRYDEQMWAIIQHYELWPTPMVDITQSLRVACSFALSDKSADFGFVFMFGLTQINGSITYSVDDEICLARLQAVCPPQAIRAHFQEGYLVSQFPLLRRRNNNSNLANRLIGKFRIPKGKDFWTDGFKSLPDDSLLPQKDDFYDELKKIQKEVYPNLYKQLQARKNPKK